MKLPKDPNRQHQNNQDENGCVQLSADTINIICRSWWESTKRRYRGYQQRWLQFCSEESDPFRADINLVLNCLADLYEKNLQVGYSAINTARSSLSSFLFLSDHPNMKLGDHFLLSGL